MSKYGIIAVKAAEYVEQGLCPRAAWQKASCEVFEEGSAAQKKGCPKNAFIGLFDEKKARTNKNAQYALKAVEYRRDNSDEIDTRTLWGIVMDGEMKVYNSQMDVVLALWNKGLIK